MVDDFGDRRQILQHIALHAAQNKGRDFFPQIFDILRMLLAGNADIFFDEPVVGAQEARHQEIHQAPKLVERVFDRRAGQNQPVGRLDHLHRFRVARAAVLDMLRFVENRVGEGHLAVGLDIFLQQSIGGDDHIVIAHLRQAVFSSGSGCRRRR